MRGRGGDDDLGTRPDLVRGEGERRAAPGERDPQDRVGLLRVSAKMITAGQGSLLSSCPHTDGAFASRRCAARRASGSPRTGGLRARRSRAERTHRNPLRPEPFFGDSNNRLATLRQQRLSRGYTEHGRPIPVWPTGGPEPEQDSDDDLVILAPPGPGAVGEPARCLGVVIEPLFITHPADASVAASDVGRQALADWYRGVSPRWNETTRGRARLLPDLSLRRWRLDRTQGRS